MVVSKEEKTKDTKMSRYFDPTNDIAFKKLFGTEEHKPLLISFLNAILSLKGPLQIQKVEFISKDQIPVNKDSKSTILDLKCTDQKGSQYIVEMQNRRVPAFVKRTQFYVAHGYVSQANKGTDYRKLKPIILLAIANHELFPDKEGVISYHKTLDTETLDHDLKDMSYVFIELPKFSKTEDQLITLKDKWLYFFRNWENDADVPSTIQEEEIIEAYHAMEKYNWDKDEQEAYLKANIALIDEYDARRVERLEGRKEGIKEGKILIAKKLLKEALTISQVAEITDLSEDDISSLKN